MIFHAVRRGAQGVEVRAGDDVLVGRGERAAHVLGVHVALAVGAVAVDVDVVVAEQVLAGVERFEGAAAHVDDRRRRP